MNFCEVHIQSVDFALIWILFIKGVEIDFIIQSDVLLNAFCLKFATIITEI